MELAVVRPELSLFHPPLYSLSLTRNSTHHNHLSLRNDLQSSFLYSLVLSHGDELSSSINP